MPVQIKRIARVSVGHVPRLGIWGHDGEDDAVSGIVVMSRDEKTSAMLPQVKAAVVSMNRDGSLPPGVRIVPFYDRGSLVDVTTHTVSTTSRWVVCWFSSSSGFFWEICAAR